VFGRRYFVLDDSSGYREDGVASWYGKQFHGKRTSSGEVYDMHAYTAAHKTLPLPSIVRVTNLDNGQSVVVTVNDRGPFVKDRLIDLSFAAAEDLGIVAAGTGRVQVEAINGAGSGPVVGQGPTRGASPVPGQPAELMYMQVGAFGDRDNAARMKGSLESSGLSNVVIRYDVATNPALYHVRIGPLADSAEYDALARRMASLSITNPRLVTESAAAGQMAD
jgi:rare lipoprotein A